MSLVYYVLGINCFPLILLVVECVNLTNTLIGRFN